MFLEYTCAGGPESTVTRTQKTKLYRPRSFDLSSFVKGSARYLEISNKLFEGLNADTNPKIWLHRYSLRNLRLGSPFCNGPKTLEISETANNKNTPI
jgi:hypothetical protein